MPFVLKTEALFDLEPGQEVEVTERCFYGGDAIEVGDEAFLWYSGVSKFLAWSSDVVAVDLLTDDKIRVVIRLISRSLPDALTTAQLAAFQFGHDGNDLSRLRRQLYAQAHNKITEISDEDAIVLRQYF